MKTTIRVMFHAAVGFFQCLLGYHAFEITQALTAHSRRIACRRCHRVYAMNDDVQCVIPWDSEFHHMYEMHGVKIEYKDWEFKKANAQVEFSEGSEV